MVHRYVDEHSKEYLAQVSQTLTLVSEDIKAKVTPRNVLTFFHHGYPILSFSLPVDDDNTYLGTMFQAVAVTCLTTGLREYTLVLNPISEDEKLHEGLLCISSCDIGIIIEYTNYRLNEETNKVDWKVEAPSESLYKELITNTYHAFMAVLPFGHFIKSSVHGSQVVKLLEGKLASLGLEMHPHNIPLLDVNQNSLMFGKLIANQRQKDKAATTQ